MNPIWNFSFYIVTWNVGTKYPEDIALHELLGLESNPKNDHHAPDFFICGFQEVNAQPYNLISNYFYQDPWVQKLKGLLKQRDYIVAKTEQMQGLLLTIFSKRKHLMHIRDIETDYVRTGLGGVWGNKGGVSIRMNVYGCSVCIMNAHLAAHDHMLDQRINDYQRILDATKYSVKVNQDIFSHDYVFWFGDLNFRLHGEESPEDIRAMVKQDKLNELLRKDQLMLAMCEGRAFSQLVERSPQFPPTFKFEPGTNEYDMKRRPAWCDRILYKAKSKTLKNVQLELEQISYKSHPNYSISDHKPVTSEFKIKVTSIFDSDGKIRKTRKSLMKTPLPLPSKPAAEPYKPIKSGLGAVKLSIAVFSAMVREHEHSADEMDDEIHESVEQWLEYVDQVPDEPAMEIKFLPFNVYNNSEENVVEYVLPANYEDAGADWIGVFKEDFAGLEEYLGFEYTETANDDPRSNERKVQVSFPESLNLPLEGSFVFMYFRSTGLRGTTSMIGISEPFTVIKRCPSPNIDTVD